MAATAAMAPPGDGGVLKTRALSALVLAPPALLAVWLGGYAFAALVAVAVALMCWEWHRMITGGGFAISGRVAASGCAVAALVAVAHPEIAVGMVLVVAVVSTLLGGGGRGWVAVGSLYAGLPSIALVWLRGTPDIGGAVVAWLLLVVWSTDIGAYAFGRMIGGPLLLPAVSPKKTWAGLLGGMLCAALLGSVVAWSMDFEVSGAVVAGAGAVIAVVAQIGDLFESWVKRRWGVKDSSGIIPGHGGVLDRVDGLLIAALAVAGVLLVNG